MNKIIKIEELLKKKIKGKTGLCWGGFDLIHSGHILHFKFAKKFCNNLIVGINSDKHFPNKGLNRPFLKEKLRAEIISNISYVDYVIIYRGKVMEKSSKFSQGFLHGKIINTPYIPLEIFEKIKPHYYFKGYEYKNKIIPEIDFLKNYSSKIIFGPKQNIFSSSKIINQNVKKTIVKHNKKILCFDLDGVICKTVGNDYKNSIPIKKNISTINTLYKKKFYIKVYTSRFMGRSNGDAQLAHKKGYNLTINQLKKWKLNFNELIMGKPSYDLIIDDKFLDFNPNWSLKLTKILEKG